MSNLQIWADLSETDAKAKNKMNFGRPITAIDATWQVWRMTQRFGKVGDGWGWTTDQIQTVPLPSGEVMVLVTVSIWTEKRSHTFGGFTGGAMLFARNKADDDAAKKATTDALTKGLSHLGMSADVFMSKFDDCKYTNKPEVTTITYTSSGKDGPDDVSSLTDGPSDPFNPKIKKINEPDYRTMAVNNLKFLIKNAKSAADAIDQIKRTVAEVQDIEVVELMWRALKPKNPEVVKIFVSKREELNDGTKEAS